MESQARPASRPMLSAAPTRLADGCSLARLSCSPNTHTTRTTTTTTTLYSTKPPDERKRKERSNTIQKFNKISIYLFSFIDDFIGGEERKSTVNRDGPYLICFGFVVRACVCACVCVCVPWPRVCACANQHPETGAPATHSHTDTLAQWRRHWWPRRKRRQQQIGN